MKILVMHICVLDANNGKQYVGDWIGDGRYIKLPNDSSIEIADVDYTSGDVVLYYPRVTIHSGEHAHIERFRTHLTVDIDYRMVDDGVPCNEQTLAIELHCIDTGRGNAKVYLPYRLQAETVTKPHPYKIAVKALKGEEVLLTVDGDKEYTVKLCLYAKHSDMYPYATGAPNDPVDYAGSEVFMTLVRLDQK